MNHTRSNRFISAGLGIAAFALGASPGTADAARLTQVNNFGSNPGALKMYLYAPDIMPPNAPVVIAMHGCLQQAADYSKGGWMELADELKFYVIFPEQTTANNPAYCFNWAGEYGDPANMQRGEGENQSIIDMVDHVKSSYSVNEDKVFVTGFSAGGAMAAVMLATWPDVFEAGAISAGVAYYCADSVNGAFRCMSPGVNKTPEQWGNLVRNNGFPRGYDGPTPRVSIWHGSADSTVVFSNMGELVDQWTNVNGIDGVPDVTQTLTTSGGAHSYRGYADQSGEIIVESYEIAGMNHGVALDPGLSEAAGCGSATGQYFYDEGICSTYLQAQFFGLDNSDSTPPTVTFTTPEDGDTVEGTITVVVDAFDDDAVESVQFFVDGRPEGVDTTSPYTFTWETDEEANGDHILQARATDASDNTNEASITVTVTGGLVDEMPPIVSITDPEDTEVVGGSVTITAQASDDFGVTAVTFYVDDEAIATDTLPPYSADWDAASFGDGDHTLTATAQDAAGNVGESDPVLVTVDSAVDNFEESFTGFPTDNPGWDLDGYRPNRSDHTGGRSRSIKGVAEASFGTTTRSATITISLGSSPTLSYWRQVSAYVANTSAQARFAVTIDGQVVDEEIYSGFGDDGDPTWTRRQGIDLSPFAGRTVELAFTVEATDSASILTTAEALIDDISIEMAP